MEGQRELPGPNTDVKKKGTMPYTIRAVAKEPVRLPKVPLIFSNVGACLNNVNNP